MERFIRIIVSFALAALVAAGAFGQTEAPAAAAPAAQPAPVQQIEHFQVAGGVGLSRQASPWAADVDLLFWTITWICVFFFVLLMVLAAWFVVKYRRRPGVAQQRSPSHNTPLELTWSVGPLVILMVIFYWGFDVYLNMRMAPANAEVINVTAQKWDWTFDYDNGAIGGSKQGTTVRVADKEVKVFAVPANRPVKLVMISKDVIHSLYVPDFRQKLDVFPMRYTTLWLKPMEAGQDHYLFCTEYCGDGHSQMGAIIRVFDEQAYQQYKLDNKLSLDDMAPTEAGKVLYLVKGCNACHSVEENGPGTGPTWWGIYGDEAHPVLVNGARTTVRVDEDYIREAILVPGAKLREGYPNQMNSYQGQITEKEISMITAYIKSLSEKGRAELEAGSGSAAPEQTPAEGGEANQS